MLTVLAAVLTVPIVVVKVEPLSSVIDTLSPAAMPPTLLSDSTVAPDSAVAVRVPKYVIVTPPLELELADVWLAVVNGLVRTATLLPLEAWLGIVPAIVMRLLAAVMPVIVSVYSEPLSIENWIE